MIADRRACFQMRNLTFQYPGSRSCALSNVSLDILDGLTTAIVGLSGSGKSSLLSILGLLWEGNDIGANTVCYHDGERRNDYTTLTAEQRTQIRKRDFGFVLQNAFLLPHFTCEDNVAMPLALRGTPLAERREVARSLLVKAGLSADLGKCLARNVSGGERQRLATLRALVHNPRVVFADEPLNNLDHYSSCRILELLLDGRKSAVDCESSESVPRTTLIVSHSLHDIYSRIDQFLVLRDGRLVEGSPFVRDQVDSLGGIPGLRRLMEHGAVS